MTDSSDTSSVNNSPPQIDLSVGEAIVAIVLAVLTIDNVFSDIERAALILTMRRMKIFETYTPEQIEETFLKVFKIQEDLDTDQLIDLAKEKLTHQLRETAFYFATDLAIADSVLGSKEKTLLEHLQYKLKINPKITVQIIEVVLIEHRK